MVSVSSFGRDLLLPSIDEDLDADDDIEEDLNIYREIPCEKCIDLKATNTLVTEKLKAAQTVLSQRDHQLRYLQDAAMFLERKVQQQEGILREMTDCKEIMMAELREIKEKHEKSAKEVDRLQKELTMKPEIPPPPPPPPPTFFRFLSWRSGDSSKRASRSKSMSRIEGRNRKPMVLNDEILDAIRNRKYSLKKVPNERMAISGMSTPITPRKSNLGDHQFMSRLFERRLRMEYSDDDEESSDGSVGGKPILQLGTF